MHYDECVHVNCARGFFTNPLPWCLQGWTHGPFQFEGTAFFFLFGTNDVTARLLPVVFGTAIVVLPYFLRRQLGHWGSIVVTALLAFSPLLMFYSRYGRNDIYIAFFMLLLIVCLWRYIEERKARYLYISAAALSLSFGTKEVSFITVAIIGIFLLILTAREFTQSVAKKVDFRGLSGHAEYLLLIATISLPLFAPFINIVWDLGRHLGDNPWSLRLIVILFVIGAAIGLRWNWRRWIISALIFWGIYILMYTVFFTKPTYLAEGIWETIAYWITQHEVERGGQPEFYYLMVVPVYEFLPVVFATVAAVYYTIKEKFFSILLLGSAAICLILYAFLGGEDHLNLNRTIYALAIGIILYSLFWRGEPLPRLLKRGSLGEMSRSYIKNDFYSRFLLVAGGILVIVYIHFKGGGIGGEGLTPVLLTVSAMLCMALYIHFGRGNLFMKFLLYWAAMSIILYSFFGEKMPWLSVHIALPTIVFAGMFIGRILGAFKWRRWETVNKSLEIDWMIAGIGLIFVIVASWIAIYYSSSNAGWMVTLFIVGFILMAVGAFNILKQKWVKSWMLQACMAFVLFVMFSLTVIDALYESYHTSDEPPKLLIYCGVSDDISRIKEKIYDYSDDTGLGTELPIVVDGGGLYDIGWRWYLREYRNTHHSLDSEAGPPDGAVLILGEKKKPVGNESWLENYDDGEEIKTHIWFPEGGCYKPWKEGDTWYGFNQSWYLDYFFRRDSYKPYWTSKAWVYFPTTTP
jgi:uncharacterized protein (TIGR03663 family)